MDGSRRRAACRGHGTRTRRGYGANELVAASDGSVRVELAGVANFARSVGDAGEVGTVRTRTGRTTQPSPFARRGEPGQPLPMEDLGRFREAQDGHPGFADAMDELRAGRKTSHWIWYVFPQLRGLGQSPMAVRYGLDGLTEAAAYVRDPVQSGCQPPPPWRARSWPAAYGWTISWALPSMQRSWSRA
jgi:hypothetical protein